MKKHIPLILLAAVLAVFLGCAAIGRYTAFVAQETHSILLTEGATGKQVEITEPDVVQAIMKNVMDQQYRGRGKNDSSGWSYSLQLLDEADNEIASLAILDKDGRFISFGGRRYMVAHQTLDTDLFVPFLEE